MTAYWLSFFEHFFVEGLIHTWIAVSVFLDACLFPTLRIHLGYLRQIYGQGWEEDENRGGVAVNMGKG